MSLAFTRLSPTPIVQTLHHSPSAAEVALWSRYPEAPFVAISNEQARLLAGLNVVDTVLHGIDTDRFTFRDQAGRLPAVSRPFHRGQGRPAGDRDRQTRRHAPDPRGRGRRTTTARKSRRTSTAARSSTVGEADFASQGEAVRRRARAALPDSGARAVRAGAGRGDGLRHAGRGARSRRRPRGGRRRRHRHGVRRPGADGRTGCRVSSISIAAACRERAVARFGVERMVDEYIAVYDRVT